MTTSGSSGAICSGLDLQHGLVAKGRVHKAEKVARLLVAGHIAHQPLPVFGE
jgi:hypothetical protein